MDNRLTGGEHAIYSITTSPKLMASMNVNRKLLILFLLFFTSLVLISPKGVLGNDSMVGESGRSVYPLKTDKIRMVSEHVKVNMQYADAKRIPRYANIECEFVFENTAHKSIIAKVGFPSSYEDYEHSPPLQNFRAYINGKPLQVKPKEEKPKYKSPLQPGWIMQNGKLVQVKAKEEKPKYESPLQPGWALQHDQYRYWYVWNVTFSALKQVTIQNSYTTHLSVEDYGTQHEFEYILETDSLWKGPIEKAVVEIIYADESQLKERFVSANPKNYAIKTNRVIWEFTNFKPSENIKVIEKGERVIKYNENR